ELHAAARNPRMMLAAQLDRLVDGESLAGLIQPALAAEDDAGQHQCLRLRAALRQAAVDHQDIEAPALPLHADRRAGARAMSARVRLWKRAASSIADAANPRARPHQSPTAP